MKIKKIFCYLSLFIFGLSAVSCGDESKDDSCTKYNVTYANTNLNSQKVKEGSSLEKPKDPKKENNVFAGWYYDEGFSNEVSFPLVVNSDMTLYAKYYDIKDAFIEARKKTVGENVDGFEYDYTLNVSVGYLNFNLEGNTVGNAKYNSSSDISFWDSHTNSGLLFIDGNKIERIRGNKLEKYSFDSDSNLDKYESKKVDSDYRYDSSCFAKAIFQYSDNKIKSLEETKKDNEYKLNTGFNFSYFIELVGNNINNPLVESILGELPETSVNFDMFVTFDDGYLNSYEYSMLIDVESIQLSLTYNLNFKNPGKVPNIESKSYNEILLSKEDIDNFNNTINDSLYFMKNITYSSYDVKVKAGVDFYDKFLDINSTFDSQTKRKVTNDGVYFNNVVEIDSDYKNADLYKSSNIEDVKYAKGKTSNGKTYLREKGLILWGDPKEITSYVPNESDSYYLLGLIDEINDISYIQKNVKDKTVYNVGLTNESTLAILKYLNNNLDLNPYGTASYTPLIFGEFDESSVDLTKSTVVITTETNILKSVKIYIKGNYKTKFSNSRDFTKLKDAYFYLNYTLNVTNEKFEPSSDPKDIK